MNFLVISQPYAGANQFTDLLNSIDNVHLHIIEYKNILNNIKPGNFIKTFFLSRYIRSLKFNISKHNCSVISTDYALNDKIPYIFKKINKDLKVILLKRKNTLRQYIDLLTTEYSSPSINCNEEEFFAFYKNLELLDIDIKIQLNKLLISYQELYYEDLCNKEGLYKIANFLNLKTFITSNFICEEEKSLKEIIKNYVNFYQTLKDTKFSQFFNS